MSNRFGQGVMVGIGMMLSGAAQGQLYGCGSWTLASPAPALYEIDPSSAQSTPVGTGAYFAASGMTFDGERLLMVTQIAVYEVDQETGATTLLHDFGDRFSFIEGAVASDPGSGELILMNTQIFAKMDLDTGVIDVVFDDGVGLDLSGATFDDQGRLWAVYFNGSQSHIAQVDPDTGLRTTLDILALPSSVPNVGGMAFDSDNGDLLVVSGSTLVDVSDLSSPMIVGDVGVSRMSGLVYVPQGEVCPADLTGDGSADFFDVSVLLTQSVDYNGDTAFDFFDISAFLQDLAAGCP